MSVFVLKIIAVIAMLIDHTAAAFGPTIINDMWTGSNIGLFIDPYGLMRSIGRIAFPIFAYLIAQGCLYTKNIGKYLLRLGVLAIISEPFFDMGFWDGSINFLRDTNIFYTLFLGVAAIALYENLQRNFPKVSNLAILAPLPMMAMAWLLSTDYSFFGVGIIFLIYLMRPDSHSGRCIALSIGMVTLYGLDAITLTGQININGLSMLAFSLISVGLIALYNGKLGPSNAAIKWGFYFFYPVHIAVLIAIRAIAI